MNAETLRFAYADPPYPGQAKRHYGSEAREVNLPLLIAHLSDFDGWALSSSSPGIREILPLLPEGIRIGAWVKPFASFKPGVNPAFAWEPVFFFGGRKRGREMPTVRDWISANITLKKRVSGAKPEAFCFWLFEFLGMKKTDHFTDLFPGSGAVGLAWEKWRGQTDFWKGGE